MGERGVRRRLGEGIGGEIGAGKNMTDVEDGSWQSKDIATACVVIRAKDSYTSANDDQRNAASHSDYPPSSDRW